MKNDSVLKKEFKHRDVERLRNLVQGKYGDKTTMGTGYSKAKEFHNEGDIWEEDGRTWTIKNGLKQKEQSVAAYTYDYKSPKATY